jgi:Sulfotransferase family
MFVNHTKEYIFVHVPKCGGTTVQETLLKHSIFANEEFTMYEFHSSLLCDAAQEYIRKGYTVIAFVRDPYTRFVSAYQQIMYMTHVYPDVYALVNELRQRNYLIPLAPTYFFTGAEKNLKVYTMENFRENMIKVLDMFGYPRIWWNRNMTENKGGKISPNEFYTRHPDLRTFVTEFYFRDFVLFKYPMKLAVTPFSHHVPQFPSIVKYDWKDVRDKPDDEYFWAMKCTFDQEQEDPKDSLRIE